MQKRLRSKEGSHLHRRQRYQLRLHETAELAVQDSSRDLMLEESDALEALMAVTAMRVEDPPHDEEMRGCGKALPKALRGLCAQKRQDPSRAILGSDGSDVGPQFLISPAGEQPSGLRP